MNGTRAQIDLGLFFLLLALLGLFHQGIFCGEWFNWEQFWHHEPLIVIALAIGITILVRRT